jgi:hypothetical protein
MSTLPAIHKPPSEAVSPTHAELRPLGPFTFPNSVYLKPSVSLPDFKTMHQTVNYARAGAAQTRMEMLQRQFEHAGISEHSLSRKKRTKAVVESPSSESDSRPFGWRSRSTAQDLSGSPGQDHGSSGSPDRPLNLPELRAILCTHPLSSIDHLLTPERSEVPVPAVATSVQFSPAPPAAAATVQLSPLPPPPIQQEAFGSILNMIELRVAEAHTYRALGRYGRKPLSDVLEMSSRACAKSCLRALHQVAAVNSHLGPLLTRIADTLESCILSPEHCDDAGVPLTYEQVAKLVLMPMLRDTLARAEEADAARKRALEAEEAAHAHSRELQSAIDEQQRKIRQFDKKYFALNVEAGNFRREVLNMQAENEVLEEMAQGAQDVRVLEELQAEVAKLREGAELAQQREHDLKIKLEGTVPLDELTVALARGDSAKAELKAARQRLAALEKKMAKLKTAMIISSTTGANPLDALRRSISSAPAADEPDL